MKLIPLVSAAVLAFSAPAVAETFETPVTDRFFLGEVKASGMYQTVYVFRWYPMNVEGRFAICGAGYYRSNAFRSVVRSMARKAEFVADGKSYPVDMSHFKKVSRNSLDSSAATCRQTNIPVAGTQQVGIRFASGTYGR